ncbi:MAG TPA: restriction endonuclease subunit S [Bellilinea sp.]|nr:restriction endonuclease subunit S [Bellilinea sp.]
MIAREPVSQIGLGRWLPYSSYQKADSQWFREIPTHWEMKRLKFVAQLNPSKSEITHLPGNIEVSFLPMEAIGDDGTLTLAESRSLDQVWQGYTYFRDQDVVVAKITPCFENGKGALCAGLVNGIGFGTTELYVLRSLPGTDAKFLFYLTVSEPFRNLGTATMYGAAGQKRVSDDFIRDFIIAFPPLPEQRTIAAFLDRETARIDRLIAAKERLITLLEEKRVALISHAVTKGLAPNVPMKDSGIEWLGEIPAHWEVKSLKYLTTSIEQGWSPSCENRPAEPGEWGVLKVGCVNGICFDPTENKALPIETNPQARYEIRPGDLLISRANTKELLGSAAVVTDTVPQHLLLCDKLYRLRIDPKLCLPGFISFALGSSVSRYQMEREATGASSSMQNIGQDTIKNLHLPVPKVREQEAIASFIHAQNARFETLSSQIQQAIKLLSEFRAALITAAVTGKIDVSNFGATKSPAKIQMANVHFRRAVFAAEIVAQLHQEPTFGHVKFQKLLFLAENTCKVDIGSQYHRAAAGPYDNRALRSIDKQLQEQKWFEVRKRRPTGYYYAPMAKAGGHREYFDRYYSDIADRLQRLIDTFRSLDTERCEIVATLYGAWQDVLAEQSAVTDEQIVREVLHNWHESKQQISEKRWYAALKWMRETGLTPASD